MNASSDDPSALPVRRRGSSAWKLGGHEISIFSLARRDRSLSLLFSSWLSRRYIGAPSRETRVYQRRRWLFRAWLIDVAATLSCTLSRPISIPSRRVSRRSATYIGVVVSRRLVILRLFARRPCEGGDGTRVTRSIIFERVKAAGTRRGGQGLERDRYISPG